MQCYTTPGMQHLVISKAHHTLCRSLCQQRQTCRSVNHPRLCFVCSHMHCNTKPERSSPGHRLCCMYAPGCLCCVCRYFLAPQKRQEGETVDAFAARVQDMIAKQVGISEYYLAGLCLLPVWCSLRQCCCWNAEALTTWASQHCPNYCVVTQSRTLAASYYASAWQAGLCCCLSVIC